MRRLLRRVLGVMAVSLALAACAPGPKIASVRDPKAPISSQVDVAGDRLAGDWVIRVSWSDTARVGETLHLRRTPGALWLDDIALPDRGKGRFGGRGGIPEWWVLWMDADNRTAAIGTPDGAFGWIMDRRAKGGGDRIRAAREIMQWMGYDMSRIRE